MWLNKIAIGFILWSTPVWSHPCEKLLRWVQLSPASLSISQDVQINEFEFSSELSERFVHFLNIDQTYSSFGEWVLADHSIDWIYNAPSGARKFLAPIFSRFTLKMRNLLTNRVIDKGEVTVDEMISSLKYHNLYNFVVLPTKIIFAETGSDFIHDYSSKHYLLGGAKTEILFAGTIQRYGWTLYLSNQSGTYKPSIENLVAFQGFLLSLGSSIDRFELRWVPTK